MAMGFEPPVLLATVSLLSALQMGLLARRVGLSRMIHKVLPPAVSGPPEFERTFRAHENCVECFPVFLVVLWTCGLFFNEPTAAAGGVCYVIARQIYFNGYVRSVKKRLPGFYLSLAVFLSLTALALIGVLREITHKYFHIHV